ncbi:hypothetical protein [Dorea sp. AM13-35]|uniref:hypothetical protein n=1 Tax=Dorea sp. AM13-35 TaxID=2293099 RepID=UPI000E540A2B|nr:hypothetical protein [Dorea sp. AM13-35]RHO39356.1 hypothetical protein DW152_09575 [Dorea sp. AM13-35]
MEPLKKLLINIFGPKSDPWTHARALRIGKKILKGISILNIVFFVLAVKYGGDATFALCGWFIVANLMIVIIIKFKDYNFIAEVIINGNDICFELPEEVIVVSKDDIKEMIYILYEVRVYLKNGKRLYADRKFCPPYVSVDGRKHQGIRAEDFVGVKFIMREEDTTFRR